MFKAMFRGVRVWAASIAGLRSVTVATVAMTHRGANEGGRAARSAAGRCWRLPLGLLLVALGAATQAEAAAVGSLGVEAGRFVLTMPGGERLDSTKLVGATFQVVGPDGAPAEVRLDSIVAATERPSILLHALSIREGAGWRPFCDADGYGRRMAMPMRGRWSGQRFVADENAWFITCTSGSQGKCVLWGYDPWAQAADGRSLLPHYEACQHMARADYDGSGTPRTRDGMTIDMWDDAGVQRADSKEDRAFAFEAGWAPDGAVCVARTRVPEVLTTAALHAATPRLAARCDEPAARARGALLFNRSQPAAPSR